MLRSPTRTWQPPRRTATLFGKSRFCVLDSVASVNFVGRRRAKPSESPGATPLPSRGWALRSHHLRPVLVPVLLQVFHERRAPGPNIRVVAGDRARLLVDVARGVFEMPRAEAGDLLEAGVERVTQH